MRGKEDDEAFKYKAKATPNVSNILHNFFLIPVLGICFSREPKLNCHPQFLPHRKIMLEFLDFRQEKQLRDAGRQVSTRSTIFV